jgi:hypothetical protein
MQKALKRNDKDGLTPKQMKVYKMIKTFIKANGYSPSYEELKYLLCLYYFFLTGIKRGATVTQLTIMIYKSMTYVVALVCHYSRQRKALFCFLENKMSKNSTILRSLAW